MDCRMVAAKLLAMAVLLHCMGLVSSQLHVQFYSNTCPNAEAIVRRVVERAVFREPRMAASLLRLHFHDCFVNGCDGSILLDDTPTFTGEKTANPNRNSIRGFDVVDEIKQALESQCTGIVSCADILALAARDSVAISGGPFWAVPLGRRDSRTASKSLANRNIPRPQFNVRRLVASFARQGLSMSDMVTLAGSHTIGQCRCVGFGDRLYNFSGTGRPDPSIDSTYLAVLQSICPLGGNANVTAFLDYATPITFDNQYYINLVQNRGLLNSDEVLFTTRGRTANIVSSFARDQNSFFNSFVPAMLKMANIMPLTGTQGEIRRNCRFVN